MGRRSTTFLSADQVKRETKPGRYFDGFGHGLYLRVGAVPDDASEDRKSNPPRSWVVRYQLNGKGKRFERGIGSAYLVDLEDARERAGAIYHSARKGIDPFLAEDEAEEQRKVEAAHNANRKTFEQVAREVFALRRANWKSEAHAERWIASLEHDVFPHIGRKPIEDVGKRDVVKILKPIWVEKNDTAKRIKQRMSAVFAYAIDAELHPGPNPTDLAKETLPRAERDRAHHDAMPGGASCLHDGTEHPRGRVSSLLGILDPDRRAIQ